MRVKCFHQLSDALAGFWIAWVVVSRQRATTNDRNVVTWVVVLAEQFANFEFDEFEQFFVVDQVALVQVHNDVRNANLATEQHVFLGLWHWAVSCRHDQNRTVHLGGTGDHVLDKVSVAGAIDVSVVTIFTFVLNVSDRNGHSLRCITDSTALGDIRVTLRLCQALCGLNSEDSTRRRRFTVVNVTDRTYVDVGLGTFKFVLSHSGSPAFAIRTTVLGEIRSSKTLAAVDRVHTHGYSPAIRPC